MLEQEETWRLRSREIWLQAGDGNTKFFHKYANGSKANNNIWHMHTEHGLIAKTYNQLARMGNTHFKQLYKAPLGTSLADIIRILGHYPRFVEPDLKLDLIKPVTMGELEGTLKWFKNSKKLKYDIPNTIYLKTFHLTNKV